MKNTLILASIITLAGCASAEVVPLGKNTYLISQTSAGGAFTNMGKLKTDVIKKANSFAAQQNKVAIPLRENQVNARLGRQPSYEYQFTLVDENDPRANGKVLKNTPTKIIESRINFEGDE
ncbi:hypothetical protein SB581_12010 [Acinetobacter baumannii]|nr:hypothetical protein SB581_12010 [Acinetobacter baumannii]